MLSMARERMLVLARDRALDDDEIVRRVRTGESALFEVLMRRHNRRIYRAVRGILRDEGDIQDVMQQAYLACYLHLDQFAGAARFSTWLARIAVNEARGRRRIARRSPQLEDRELDVADHPDDRRVAPESPEDRAAAQELVAAIEAVVDRLPEVYRTVLVLRDVEGMATADAAEALGISEELVKVRLHRGRAMVRERLGDDACAAIRAAFSFGGARCDLLVARVLGVLLGCRLGPVPSGREPAAPAGRSIRARGPAATP
jgi:RNA polymerase sigma-70 factor (ECF subfamily)